MAEWDVYIGTFGAEFRNSAGEAMGEPSEGVERFRFDDVLGALRFVETLAGLNSASFLAWHPTLPVLYTIERELDLADQTLGSLATLSVDANGSLGLLAKVPSCGDSPAHVSAHPSGRHAYAVNYRSGHVAAFPIDDKGIAGPADRVILHEGHGPHPRQESPHPHQARPLPNRRWVLINDLGLDTLFAYATGEDDGRLLPEEPRRIVLTPGCGPRHMVVHPSGRFVFVLGELNSTVNVVAAEDGIPERLVNSSSTRPPDYEGANSTAEIVLHPDGETLYVSNRGSDTVAIFHVDLDDGSLWLLGHEATRGRIPRNINLDPTGSHLLVANQNPGSFAVFRVGSDRLLSLVDDPLPARTPCCILFARAPLST